MMKHEGREERRIIYLGHRCIPQLEINERPAESVGRWEVLCGRPATG